MGFGMIGMALFWIVVCGTCMDARGMADGELVEGAQRSTLAELTASTQWAEKVLVF